MSTLTKGILGLKRDPKRPLLFSFNGETWPSSDDSEDSDFSPDEKERKQLDKMDIYSDTTSKLLNTSECSIAPSSYEHINYKEQRNHIENKCFQLISPENANRVSVPLLLPDIQRQTVEKLKIKELLSRKSITLKKKKRKLEDRYDSETGDHIKKRKKHKKSKEKELEQSVTSADTVEFIEGPWGRDAPEEILIKIFLYVVRTDGAIPFISRISKVCRLWHRIAQYLCLWECVDFSWGKVHLNEYQLIKMCSEKQLSFTKELNLSGWGESLTHYSIEAIAEHCPQLSSINLSRCIKMSSDCIRTMADKCSKLSVLDLSGTCRRHNKSSPVSPASLCHYVSKCGEHLSELYIAENDISNFTAIIKLISESCPNFQVLDASNLSSGARSAVLPVEELQYGCPKLRVLRLANSNITLATKSLVKQAQSPGFPNLEELSVAVENGCGLGDNDIERLLKASCKLRLLDIRGCRSISVSELVRLPAWDIQHLYLSQCLVIQKPGFDLVLQKWGHSLKDVDLSWAVNDEAINQALTMIPQGCPLETLNLCGSAVSYQSIKLLLSRCTRLQYLNLQSCRGLPRGIKRIYSEKDLFKLHQLINDKQMEKITAVN